MPKLRTAVRVFPPSSTRLIQHSYFCTEMGDRMMKQLHWACTATGVHSSENLLFFWLFWNWQCSHFLFLGGHTHSGQAKVTFGRIWHNSLLTAAQYGLCNDSDHGKQKKHDPSLPVKDSIMGPHWPLPVISIALRVSLTRRLAGPKLKEKFLILLEHFRVANIQLGLSLWTLIFWGHIKCLLLLIQKTPTHLFRKSGPCRAGVSWCVPQAPSVSPVAAHQTAGIYRKESAGWT